MWLANCNCSEEKATGREHQSAGGWKGLVPRGAVHSKGLLLPPRRGVGDFRWNPYFVRV